MRATTWRSRSYAPCGAGFGAPTHSTRTGSSVCSGTAPNNCSKFPVPLAMMFRMLVLNQCLPAFSFCSSQLRRQDESGPCIGTRDGSVTLGRVVMSPGPQTKFQLPIAVSHNERSFETPTSTRPQFCQPKFPSRVV